MPDTRHFPDEEYARRRLCVRGAMEARGLDALLVAAPENVYYLTGLNHMGYFAYELLILPLDGEPILITRAMEAATIRDQVPDVRHVGYTDGKSTPIPAAENPEHDIVMGSTTDSGRVLGIEPWSASMGVETRAGSADAEAGGDTGADDAEAARNGAASPAVAATLEALNEAGLSEANLGLEMRSSFLPYHVADAVVTGMPQATWTDGSGVVDDCRVIQSPLEIQCTREAARISDSMMQSAMAMAGRKVRKSDIIATAYSAMFRRGGTYPGFVPLVRSSRTLDHEHGTWGAGALRRKDILFLEMAGCVWRYHAPIGRLVFIDRAPKSAVRMQEVCLDAMNRAAEAIGPGAVAKDVYAAWQSRLDEAGLDYYRRHHCGYSVGIGFPPSWSGSGVPVGLRPDSDLELQEGMVFHLMSWLLRTGQGDSFLSDTVLVTADGCEFLTRTDRSVAVR